jgi:hypothetical protein
MPEKCSGSNAIFIWRSSQRETTFELTAARSSFALFLCCQSGNADGGERGRLPPGAREPLSCAQDGRGRGGVPQNDVLTIERSVALSNRHCRLSRVVPDGGKAIRFGIEAGDSSAGTLGPISIEEREIRLQELAVLDHILLTRSFRYNRFPIHREERFDYVPVARKLHE